MVSLSLSAAATAASVAALLAAGSAETADTMVVDGSPAATGDAAPDMLFYSMGDWGGASDQSPTTPSEKANGQGMQAASDALGVKPSFVMAVGDNFYGSGIHGSEFSQRFEQTFEDVFTEDALQCPWYVIAGNHDHLGNVTAQIEYSHDSARWTYPDHWYTWTVASGPNNATTTQVVYIDTVVLAGMSFKDDETGEIVSGAPHPAHNEAAAATQLEWLEQTLAASTADYLWVSGHYPVYSHCEHGPTLTIIASVLPLMEKYNASGYIAGHDHCSAHYEAHDMSFVVAGAGKECCYSPKNLDNKLNPGEPLFRMDSDDRHGMIGGFASYAVTADSTTIRYHGDTGEVLYTGTPVAPRTATARKQQAPTKY